MGQTLTHGVYLPDEGERNCYAGLAANWQLLDGAVGTIAEHTTQIAGKAPLVHTHTKSDITDFPAYGNAAGTICEGNDSRLSDARTPVSHTHTKSDVTDLLNSNFIPSANNSYDLGSSNYQWNNLYAKGYYDNGVAWGLDKANVWTRSQTFNADTIYRSTVKRGTAPRSVVYMEFADYKDSSNNRFSLIGASYTTAKASDCCIYAYKTTVATGNAIGRIGIGCDSSGNVYTIAPTPASSDNSTQIATTAYVKSQGYLALNGLNPGSLSLPKYDTASAQDISGNMIPDTSGNIRIYPTLDGWMYVDFNISNATITTSGSEMYVQVKDNAISDANYVVNFAFTGSNHIFVYLPVLKSALVILQVNFTGFSIGKGYIYPCQGSV